MKVKLLVIGFAALGVHLSPAATLLEWNFNDAAATSLQSTSQTGTVAGTWLQNIAGVATNGTGLLTTTGTLATSTPAINRDGIGITANSGVYELALYGVKFTNTSGNDYITFGFRTTQTASEISTSRERANFKVGDFNGTAGLDLQASVTPATPLQSATNITTDLTQAFDFVLRLDTGSNLATAFYKIGSGALTQLGSSYTIDTATTINTVALRLIFSDDGGGDSISIDRITLTAIPEPGTFTLLASCAAFGLLARRRRN